MNTFNIPSQNEQRQPAFAHALWCSLRDRAVFEWQCANCRQWTFVRLAQGNVEKRNGSFPLLFSASCWSPGDNECSERYFETKERG